MRLRPKRPPKATSLAFVSGTPARHQVPGPRSDASYAGAVRYLVDNLRSSWPSRRALVIYVAADTSPLMTAALVAAVERVRRTRPERLVVFREANSVGEWVPTLVTQGARLRPYAPGQALAPAAALPAPLGFQGQGGRRYLPLVTSPPLGVGLVGLEVPWETLHLYVAAQVPRLLATTPSVGLALTGPVRAVLAAAAAIPPTCSVRVTLTSLGRWTVPVLECDPLQQTG